MLKAQRMGIWERYLQQHIPSINLSVNFVCISMLVLIVVLHLESVLLDC